MLAACLLFYMYGTHRARALLALLAAAVPYYMCPTTYILACLFTLQVYFSYILGVVFIPVSGRSS
jgi:hypothetical protein